MWVISVFIIITVPLILVIIGMLISAPRYKGPVTDHFDGSRFLNSDGIKAKEGLEVLKWMASRKRGPWKENLNENYGKHPLGQFTDGIRIIFINHSSFLIQVDGVNILTDPVWSMRTSPFQWIGPKRKKSPGIRFGDLPRIHVVLLSHNHYDHLDLDTMRMVFGAHHPRIISPLGIKAFLEKQYISGVTEADWWEEFEQTKTVQIQVVPAQHFSGRGLLDRDATLWCGYVIKTSKGNIYFAGDTGYNQRLFQGIRSHCGPLKISLLPIGAYKPNWFMSPIHTSPEEAIKIHLDVQSQTSIATHFGTFPLADDGGDEPEVDLNLARGTYNLKQEEFLILKEGEGHDFY